MRRRNASLSHNPGAGANPRGNSTAGEPRGQCSPPPRGARGREPRGWTAPRSSCLPHKRSDRGSGRTRRAPCSSPAAAHCIFARAGRGELGLRRLTVRAGLAEAARDSKGGARAWSAPGAVATSFIPSGLSNSAPGLPSVRYPPSQRSPSSVASGASSPASHPCRPGGRSRVNIGRREPFAAQGQGRSVKEDPFQSWTPGGFLVS